MAQGGFRLSGMKERAKAIMEDELGKVEYLLDVRWTLQCAYTAWLCTVLLAAFWVISQQHRTEPEPDTVFRSFSSSAQRCNR